MLHEVKRQKRKVKRHTQQSAVSFQQDLPESRKLTADCRITYYLFLGLILICLFTLLSSCSDFQPLQENDQYYFSINGFLDASADTQWVRITPAREQLETSSDVPEMTVTIENLGNGENLTMRDSLFQKRGAKYLNFWTTESINNNQSYKVVAEHPNGKRSEATIEIPGELPTPTVVIQTSFSGPTTYSVVVDGDVHVADVRSLYYIRITTSSTNIDRMFSFSYRNSVDTTETNGGSYTYHLEPENELEEIEQQLLLPPEGQIEVIHRQIYVASTSTPWTSEVMSMDDLTYALPQTFSNIENGVGFLAGVDSKYVPYASCENEAQTQIIPCEEEKSFW